MVNHQVKRSLLTCSKQRALPRYAKVSSVKPGLMLFLFLITALHARAAAYWLELNGDGKVNHPVTIQLCYGSMNEQGIRQRDTGRELHLTGDFRLWLLDPQGHKSELPLAKQKDCWQAVFTPDEKGTYRIIGLNDKHPVVDRSASGGESIRPIDYVGTAYMAQTEEPVFIGPLQPLDMVSTVKDGWIEVQAFRQGKPAAAGTKLRVFNPDNWEKELILDEKGRARFYPTLKGLYIIRLDWTQSGIGTYQETPFSSTRQRCNYFLKY